MRIIDVGTDHGHIPIVCVLSGKALKGLALDINKGPLERAGINAAKYKVTDKIDLIQTNGLNGIIVNNDDCVVIAGIGGLETISVMEKAGTIPCRIVLQPQRSAFELRSFLDISGYSIISEKVVSDRGKFYTVIISKYTGLYRQLTQLESYAGKNIRTRVESACSGRIKEPICGYLDNLIESTSKKLKSDPFLKELLEELFDLKESSSRGKNEDK
jgi:tRNA (adenine22-N1)-methyltransferase